MSLRDKTQSNEAPLFSPREIGKRLGIARKLMKISLEDMARGLNTSTDQIIRVEQGKRLIPGSWLATLAAVFNIDAHWLATGARPVAGSTAGALNDMEKVMKVPVVRKFINFQFDTVKLIFKDEIKKPIIPWRNK